MIGPNGADEPTLFNLVSGFDQPDAGGVRLNRAPICGVTPPALRKISPICSIAFHDLASG